MLEEIEERKRNILTSQPINFKEVKILSHIPNLSIPKLLSPEKLYNLHPLVASTFSQIIPILPKPGRLEYVLKYWTKSTNDPTILEKV